MKRPSWLSWPAACVGRCVELAQQKGFKLTKLAILLVQEIARAGKRCFLHLRTLAARILRDNGKHPHPGSIQRLLRELRAIDVKLLLGKRLFPGQQAHFKVNGETMNVKAGQGLLLVWFNPALGFPDYEDCGTAAEQRVVKTPQVDRVQHAAANELEHIAKVIQVDRVQHAAVGAMVPSQVSLPVSEEVASYRAEYEAMAAPAIAIKGQRQLERARREDAAMYESIKRGRGS